MMIVLPPHRRALVLALLVARATPGALAADLPAPSPRRLGGDLETYRAPADPGAAVVPAPDAMSGPLTLREAVAIALLHNPALAAFSWSERAREARVVQAGLLPHPSAQVEIEDVAGSGQRRGFEDTQTTLWLSQRIELGGKRAKRRRLAALERDLAGWDYEARRLEVLTDVTKAFVSVLAVQEEIAIADELVRIAGAAVGTVQATVTAGAVSPVEARRARVALEQARIERETLGRDLEAARAALAATLGANAPTFGEATGTLPVADPPPPLDALLSGVEQNPDLARWSTELAQREAAVAVEHARVVPDLTLTPGIRHFADNDDTALVLAFSVPLPIFNRNQGGVLEAGYRLAQARADRRSAEVSIRTTLESRYQSLVSNWQQARALHERVIPEAEAAFTGAREAYERGLFRYLEVLDAQRTLFELRRRQVRTRAVYHAAIADVERLTGAPIASFGSVRTVP